MVIKRKNNCKQNFILLFLLFNLLSTLLCDSNDQICNNTCKFDSTTTSFLSNKDDFHYCDPNCRYSFQQKQSYYCSEIQNSNNKYFYIHESSYCVSTSNCRLSENNIDKVVSPSNECIFSCSNIENNQFFELGDFCIYINDLSLYRDNYEVISINNNYNLLKCKENNCMNNYEIDGKNYFTCIDCGDCEKGFDNEQKVCLKEKSCGKKKIIVSGNQYVCRSECDYSDQTHHFEYTENNEDDSEPKVYCLDQCPQKANYYYENGNLPSKCLEGCNENDFYIEDEKGNFKCLKICDGLYWKEDSKNFYACKNPSPSDNKCPENYKYQYFNMCFKSCEDTISKINKKTYSLLNEDLTPKYQCLDKESCLSEGKKYEEGTSSFCVEKCSRPNKIYVNNTNECVNECKVYIYEDENHELKCVGECPKNYYLFDKAEGYYILDNTGPLECLDSCPPHHFYYYDNNICYPEIKSENANERRTKCGDIGLKTYPYSKSDNKYECYPSCKEIGTEYIYENNYICSKEFNCEDYYYKDDSGMTKCVSKNEYIKSCSKKDYLYLRGKECVKRCESNEYVVEPKQNIYFGVTELGECFIDVENVKDIYKYYSYSTKYIGKECSYFRIEDGKEEIGYTPKTSSDGTCVKTCPYDYPYQSIDKDNDNKKICVSSCQDFFYVENDGTKKCVDNCKSIGKYHFKDSKECINLEECKKNNIIYYYDTKNNTCYSSCLVLTEKPFLFLEEDSPQHPQKCLKNCPQDFPYYFEEDKLCLSNCGDKYIKEENSFVCVKECEDGQKIVGGNTCSDDCGPDEPFMVTESKNVKKCYPSCESAGTDYKLFDEDKECFTSCPPREKYQLGSKCLSECPPQYYVELDTCKSKCTTTYYKKKLIDNENNDEYNFECINHCDKYIVGSSPPYECVDNCPLGENFIGENMHCRKKCDPEKDGKYYSELANVDYHELGYKIYLCSKEIPSGHYLIFDSNKTIKVDEYCPEPYYTSKYENICYETCKNSPYYPFSTKTRSDDGMKKVCASECLDEGELNYNENKICVHGCNQFHNNKLINDENNACVSKCKMDSLYKFETIENGDATTTQRHCSKKCNENEPRFTNLTSYYYCSQTCSSPYNCALGNECQKSCPKGYFYEKNGEEIICKEKCDGAKPNYYRDTFECIENCGDHFIYQDTEVCSPNCSDFGGLNYHKYEPNADETGPFTKRTCVLKCPEDKPFLTQDNKCEEYCNQDVGGNNKNIYLPENKTCLAQCPDDRKELLVEDFPLTNVECVLNCPSPLFEDNKKCIPSCGGEESESGFKFYNPTERKCLPKCNETLYYTDGYECVTSCEGKYTDNRKCVEKCPSPRIYFQEEFTHGEENTKKKCLDNCPDDYPFVKIEDGLYKCLGTCDYYINTTFPKECKNDCTEYYDLDDKERHICLDSCPDKYYKDEDGKKKCVKECPEDTYKEINSNECVKAADCKSKIVDYEKKKCVYGCNAEQFWSEEDNIKYCLEKCNSRFGPYQLNGKQCLKECDSSKYLVDVSNPSVKKCSCKNLFYEDSTTGEMKCLNPDITECGEGSDSKYKYRIYKNYITNQCSEHCFGVLSPNEDICYASYDNCSAIPNTELLLESNNLKCDCSYRWYVENENHKKICLGKDEPCSKNPFIFEDTLAKQCLMFCPAYEFDYKCFSNGCPGKSEPEPGKQLCRYKGLWYKTSDNDYKFLDGNECPVSYPYLIVATNQCVQKCIDTKYPSVYKYNCSSSCEAAIPGGVLTPKEPERTSKHYGKVSFECQCANYWYLKEDGEIECGHPDEGYDFLVKETYEYVKICPSEYPYHFNKECYKLCDIAKNKYQINVKSREESLECICDSLWREKDGIITCLKDVNCQKGELIVDDTNQCIEGDECPLSSPLKFNGRCYKECPHNSKEKIETGKDCECEKAWYTQSNGNKYCLGNEKCPDTHPLQIFSTKECVALSDCPNDLKKFNDTCYEDCPDIADDDPDNDNKCICNKNFGFWYREGDKMFCQLSACPNNKYPYQISETMECISDCIKNKYYEYNNICYKDKCPDPTISQNEKINPYKCIVRNYTKAINLGELLSNLKSEIVTLYKNAPDGGIVYTNFNTTMQIYGIKKNDDSNKEFIQRASLSYIDINSCKNKIYYNNRMEDNDEIIVVKYDLSNDTIKSLVKPVEYEFISSRTGQILDLSVCTKDDILISYSLSDLLNYYKKSKNRRLEDPVDPDDPDDEPEEEDEKDDIIPIIQEQYNKGKELYSIYHLDSFDINSKIYTDRCFSLEIDGKDLVLEDRVKYLYPLFSLCEENCTYSHVDFDSERIYCNCPLKTQLILNRKHEFVLNKYDIEYIKSKQHGPTNLPVMKCMSRLSEKNSINKNGAFFYSLIILLLEFLLAFVSIFYSYQILKNQITKNSMGNEEEKEIDIEKIENDRKQNNTKSKNKNNNIVYKTSERLPINAPPRKRDIKNDEIDINDIKLEKKYENKIEKYEITNEKNDAETDDPRLHVEDENNSFSKDYESGILDAVHKEQQLLRIKFELAVSKDKSDVFIILLTEVCDKIYIIKILCLLGKYDMFTMYFSAYLLYHLLLLTFVTCFYDIKTIQNIWNKEDYPGLNYHLGYGLLACLIVWAIYKIFLCILNNEDIIKKYLKRQINTTNSSKNDDVKLNNKKFNNLLYKIKTGMVAFFIVEFVLGIICLLYLSTFCAVYVGTKKNIFKTYGIALVEVLIIKIIYGLLLGIFRKVGLAKQKKVLYNIAYYLDNFVH